MRLTYFTNRYPAVSHTFIRREIAALEAAGVAVTRVALRADPIDRLPDPADQAEHARTRLLLAGGKARVALAVLREVLRAPARAVGVLAFALRLGRRSGVGASKMIAYWAEALLLRAAAAGTDQLRVHFGTNGAVVARLAHRLGAPPYSIAYHGPDEFDAPERWDLAGTVHEAAFVTAITSYCAAQLMRWTAPADWPKIAIVRCLVDPGQFAPAPLPDAPFRLVTVARLAPQKGLPLLLEALAGLADPPPLTIVGDGPFRAALEDQARALGLPVRFTGALGGDAVRAELAAAHAFVLPSFAEGLPVVIMEAQGVHRPVIATAIAGVGELVRDGETGWLVPAGDVAALRQAIAAARDSDAATRARLGEAGGALVRARHQAAGEAPKLLAAIRAAATAGE